MVKCATVELLIVLIVIFIVVMTVIYPSMDISSGSHISAEHLMFTQSYGNFNSKTGMCTDIEMAVEHMLEVCTVVLLHLEV